MTLGIVILNYKTADLTVACLRSVAADIESLPQTADRSVRVVVVDNFSNDDSIPRIQSEIEKNGWSAWASILPLPRNGGFAYGNNLSLIHIFHREMADLMFCRNLWQELFIEIDVLVSGDQTQRRATQAVSYTHLDVYKRQASALYAASDASSVAAPVESERN